MMAGQGLEYIGTWEEIALHASEFRGRKLHLVVLPAEGPVQEEQSAPVTLSGRTPTARELLKLPLEERNRILSAQAAKAEVFYRTDPDLTDFEAFEEDALFYTIRS